jgi:hypothetical protein
MDALDASFSQTAGTSIFKFELLAVDAYDSNFTRQRVSSMNATNMSLQLGYLHLGPHDRTIYIA